eukprot:scaffold42176_cov71-Phaeocystis_antarctica.AAC.5
MGHTRLQFRHTEMPHAERLVSHIGGELALGTVAFAKVLVMDDVPHVSAVPEGGVERAAVTKVAVHRLGKSGSQVGRGEQKPHGGERERVLRRPARRRRGAARRAPPQPRAECQRVSARREREDEQHR